LAEARAAAFAATSAAASTARVARTPAPRRDEGQEQSGGVRAQGGQVLAEIVAVAQGVVLQQPPQVPSDESDIRRGLPILARGVREAERITTDIGVGVDATGKPDRIALQIAPRAGVVVAEVCVFRRMPVTGSGPCRSQIPEYAGQDSGPAGQEI
jgi:hypothetical protein